MLIACRGCVSCGQFTLRICGIVLVSRETIFPWGCKSKSNSPAGKHEFSWGFLHLPNASVRMWKRRLDHWFRAGTGPIQKSWVTFRSRIQRIHFRKHVSIITYGRGGLDRSKMSNRIDYDDIYCRKEESVLETFKSNSRGKTPCQLPRVSVKGVRNSPRCNSYIRIRAYLSLKSSDTAVALLLLLRIRRNEAVTPVDDRTLSFYCPENFAVACRDST